MNGYSLVFVPMSWVFGRWDVKETKTLWGFGPFRFALHRGLSDNWGDKR